MKQTFYSNGKLLLTGEYTVLDGAKALALPTVYGQYLDVETGTDATLVWKSLDADGTVWYEDVIPLTSIIAGEESGGKQERDMLIKILHEAYKLNPAVLSKTNGFNITTRLTFPRLWGLGTSSTLINNIAQWFRADAFKLLNASFGGSGYDIACAQHNTPILYQLKHGNPVVKTVDFNPPFKDKLFFVYLNKKQNSRSAITAYRTQRKDIDNLISKINSITESLVQATDFSSFKALLENHEAIMSRVLGFQTIKEELFPDFEGTIKSLGAWGGDFIMAAVDDDPTPYFENKGYNTIIPYTKMILK